MKSSFSKVGSVEQVAADHVNMPPLESVGETLSETQLFGERFAIDYEGNPFASTGNLCLGWQSPVTTGGDLPGIKASQNCTKLPKKELKAQSPGWEMPFSEIPKRESLIEFYAFPGHL